MKEKEKENCGKAGRQVLNRGEEGVGGVGYG